MGHIHQSHPAIIKRLKRADGHLRKIIEMIDEGRPCPEVSQQLQAVYKAIGNAKGLFVQEHIEGCLSGNDDSPPELKQKMNEIREMSKYL